MSELIQNKDHIIDQFRNDVVAGLSAEEKHISSKYFYDQKGDVIFQRIMATPEYYLTNAENAILRDYSKSIIELISSGKDQFEIIELGAGDGTKTKHLLKKALELGKHPIYRPVDISQHILNELETSLKIELPSLEFQGIRGEYFRVFESDLLDTDNQKCVLFLGSNIGNLLREAAVKLLRTIASQLSDDDHLLIGFDLKKDPAKILAAYNDASGATRDFNLNLLHRMNTELGANFNVNKFMHAPVYDPFHGRALSYLVSTEDQEIKLEGVDKVFPIRAWEAIHLEISQKYDPYMISSMAKESGLEIVRDFTDELKQYLNVVLKKKK